MRLDIVGAIFLKEIRDSLRDRRTLFMMIGLPVLIYPLLFLASTSFQSSQMEAREARSSRIAVWGELPGPMAAHIRKDDKISLLPGEGFTAALSADVASGRFTPPPEPLDPPPAGNPMEKKKPDPQAETPVAKAARELTLSRRVDAVLVLWPGFGSQMETGSLARASVFFDTVRQDSTKARERVVDRMVSWRRHLLAERERKQGLPAGFAAGVEIRSVNIAPEQRRSGMLIGTILGMILILMSAMGGFYTAIDLTAGEKERGTMQTLLCAPVSPMEIIGGKFLAVWGISSATALANLASMALTAGRIASFIGDFHITPQVFLLALLALLPVSFMMSAIYLAVAAFARDFKEGQNYLMPVMLAIQMPMILTSSPSVELNARTAYVPLVNVMLLIKALFLGEARMELIFHVLVASAAYALLALMLAARVFERQNLLLGGRESFGSVFDMRPDPGGVPSPSLAIAMFALVLVINFYGQLSLLKWGLVAMIATVMYGFFLAPPLGAAIALKFSLRRCFQLRVPPASGVLAAVLAGSSTWLLASQLTQRLLPPPPELTKELGRLLMLDDKSTPLALVLALAALSPGICEEALFRGFILSGLRGLGQWPAIGISALLFGVAHGSIYRMIPTVLLGLLLGYAVWKTGSLVTGMIIHALNNGIVITLARQGLTGGTTPGWMKDMPPALLGGAAIALAAGLILLARLRAPAEPEESAAPSPAGWPPTDRAPA